MKDVNHFVLFQLDSQKFALPLSNVQQIARSVEVTPIPDAPAIVIGVINVRGKVIPVVNIRQRFGFKANPVDVTDHLIIGRTSKRSVALLVDDVNDIVEIKDKTIIEQDEILPNMQLVDGVVKMNGDIILIHDLEKFLSLDEEKQLDKALSKRSETKQ